MKQRRRYRTRVTVGRMLRVDAKPGEKLANAAIRTYNGRLQYALGRAGEWLVLSFLRKYHGSGHTWLNNRRNARAHGDICTSYGSLAEVKTYFEDSNKICFSMSPEQVEGHRGTMRKRGLTHEEAWVVVIHRDSTFTLLHAWGYVYHGVRSMSLVGRFDNATLEPRCTDVCIPYTPVPMPIFDPSGSDE